VESITKFMIGTRSIRCKYLQFVWKEFVREDSQRGVGGTRLRRLGMGTWCQSEQQSEGASHKGSCRGYHCIPVLSAATVSIAAPFAMTGCKDERAMAHRFIQYSGGKALADGAAWRCQ
jgi:hypothetical protein